MKNYVEVGRKGLNDHTENVRLDISLTKSDTNIYRSINYRKIIALKQGYTNYEFLEMEDPHDRFKDYAEESYIDNTEVFRDALPDGHEPENRGFYINFGKLKLKTLTPNDHGHKHRDKKKKHKHHKERKRSKSDKISVTEANPVNPVLDAVPNIARLASSTPLTSHPKERKSSKSDKLSVTEANPVSDAVPNIARLASSTPLISCHKPHKEVKKLKSNKLSVTGVNPVSDAVSNIARLASSTPLISPSSHAPMCKEDRKKLKLLRKEKRSRNSVEEAKSPKRRKKKSDGDVTLDKILMPRTKEMKNSEGKVNKSPALVLLPDIRNALYPCYKAAS